MAYLSTSPLPISKVEDPSDYDGLVVRAGGSYERVIMSTQEIVEDALAVVPKLHAAVKGDTIGRRWQQRRSKNGVDHFKLLRDGGGDPDDDVDIAHAVVAKTELRCHLNEVLNVLVNATSHDCDASLRSLFGSKCKRGNLLLHKRRKVRRNSASGLSSSQRTPSSTRTKTEASSVGDGGKSSEHAVVSVQLLTLHPRRLAKLHTKHKSQQTLAFGCCTQKSPTGDRAVHIMKTLPKPAHEQLVLSTDSTALRRQLDHIAVGFDIKSTHGSYGARSHTTHIVTYAYASGVSPTAFFDSSDSKQKIVLSKREMAAQRKSVMNPEARGVVAVLAKSLRNMETVIRRRRFGFQSFVYFSAYDAASHTNDHTDDHISPSASTPTPAPRNCQVCVKPFSLFRRDRFCQLCGHIVCGECSRMYDVEPRPGQIRQNCICVHCVARVDACVFDDEDLLAALGPVVVDVDESVWDEDYPLLSESIGTSVNSSRESMDEIPRQLCSHDPRVRSRALEKLANLVRTDEQTPTSTPTKESALRTDPQHVIDDVLHQLTRSVRAMKSRYTPKNCEVYDGVRDYAYEFGASSTAAPLAPQLSPTREAARLKHISKTGILSPSYDREGLNLLARLAAERLKCSTGYISVVGAEKQHIVGSFQVPGDGLDMSRNEALCAYSVYAETPVVLTNSQRDLRFAQLPIVRDVGFKFYAGFPIKAADGTVIASICAADMEPHSHITTKEYATMATLSDLAAELLAAAPLRRRREEQ